MADLLGSPDAVRGMPGFTANFGSHGLTSLSGAGLKLPIAHDDWSVVIDGVQLRSSDSTPTKTSDATHTNFTWTTPVNVTVTASYQIKPTWNFVAKRVVYRAKRRREI